MAPSQKRQKRQAHSKSFARPAHHYSRQLHGTKAAHRRVRLELPVTLREFMECGGKRSATPLWLERLVLRWIWHKHQPKRRRASLAAALHMAVADTFNRTHRALLFRRSIILELEGLAYSKFKLA